MVSPATGIEDAGGDWYHEGGIILSKKPPEWHLSLLRQRPASDSNFRSVKEGQRPVKNYFRNILIIFNLDFVYG